MRTSGRGLSGFSLAGASLATLAVLAPWIAPDRAEAACSGNAPASGTTVTCDGATATGVIAPDSSDVTLQLQAGGSIVPASGPAVALGPRADVRLGTDSIAGNEAASSYAVLLGDGAALTVDGLVQGRGGVTGPTQGTGSTGLAGATVTVNAGGRIVTNGSGHNAAIDGRGGGNVYAIHGAIRATGVSGQGIEVGDGDVLTLGATGSITTLWGDTSTAVDGFGSTGVTVATAAGSLIELHGIGRGIDLGDNATVTVGGTIRSFGDAASTNSAGGGAIDVGAGSTVHLLQGGQLITGNMEGLGNQGDGGTGIIAFASGRPSNSTIIVDGLIDTQRAQGIFTGIGNSITIGETGRITTCGSARAIFGNLQTTTAANVITIDVRGRVEALGTGAALFLSGNRGQGETVETAAVANVTVAEGATLFAQSNLAYGQDDGFSIYPEIVDNLVVAGTIGRGTPGRVIDLNDGADRITLLPTASIVGTIDGGTDVDGLPEVDTIAFAGAAGTSGVFDFATAPIQNFEAGEKIGAGAWTLTGDAGTGLGGSIAVKEGRLTVDAAMAGAGATVASGATLAGNGSLGGAVEVAGGGTLAGTQGATLAVGSLALSDMSNVDVALGAPGTTALFDVAGALRLDGRLNVSALAGFDAGTYRLFDYGGALTDAGLVIATVPIGFNPGNWAIDTDTAGQVDLVVVAGLGEQYWDGGNMTPGGVLNGRGGTGVWNGTSTNWTNQAGSINAPWASQVANFAASGPATVTVEGERIFTGMRFLAGADYGFVAGTAGALRTDTAATDIILESGEGADSRATIGVAIGGTGGLVKRGGGTLILSAANGYSGGTAVAEGVLQLGAGGTTGSVLGDIVNNGTLLFDRSDLVDFAAAITGSGRLVQAGGGTLRFGTVQAYSGPTTVAAGTLVVDGSIASSSVDVGAAGTLAGTGTVGAARVAGRIAPGGDAIGTLTVDGDYVQLAGSTYAFQLGGGGQQAQAIPADPAAPVPTGELIRVLGSATIEGGRVAVANVAGTRYRLADRTLILTATEGRSGVYDGLDLAAPLTQPFLTLGLGYTESTVFLEAVRNGVAFRAVGETPNQRAAADGVEGLPQAAPLHVEIASVADAATARTAFDLLSGEIHASLKGALLEESRYLREAVLTRLQAGGESDGGDGGDGGEAARSGLWGQAYGGWGDIDGDGNAASVDRSTKGLMLGADFALGGGWRAGIAGEYSRSTVEADARFSRARADGYRIAASLGGAWGQARLRLGASAGWHDAKVRRAIDFPGVSDAVRAGYDLKSLQLFGEAGYAIETGSARIEPFVGLAHVSIDGGSFAESGGLAALDGAKRKAKVTFGHVGAYGSAGLGTALALSGKLAWRHRLDGGRPTARLAFDGGPAFTVAGAALDRDAAVIALDLQAEAAPGVTLSLGYSGQIGGRYTDHGGRAGLVVRF